QNARAETYRMREELARKEKETLRQSHQFPQSTLDALAIRIAILDASGTILAVNTAWRRLAAEDPLAGVGCDVGTNYLLACRTAPCSSTGCRRPWRGPAAPAGRRSPSCSSTSTASR